MRWGWLAVVLGCASQPAPAPEPPPEAPSEPAAPAQPSAAPPTAGAPQDCSFEKAKTLWRMGRDRMEAGRYEEARDVFRKSLACVDHKSTRLLLAQTEALLGRQDVACAHLKIIDEGAHDTGPNNVRWIKIRSDLVKRWGCTR